MPINRILVDEAFTPEQQHVLSIAFDTTLHKLHLVDRNDPICEMNIYKRGGVTDAEALTEMTMREIGPEEE